MSDIANPITESSPENVRELLRQLLREKARLFPLSYAQQRLWLLEQLRPGNTAYNIPRAVRISGRLGVGVLEQALGEIVRRHQVCRTRFVEHEGSPAQIVDPAGPAAITFVDLGGLGEAMRAVQIEQLIGEEIRRPFNLGDGALLRISLLRLAPKTHILLIVMHHIIVDMWSISILIRELSVLYDVFQDGTPSPLAELTVQYTDFARWQRDWLRGEVLEKHLGYWKKRLAGAPAALDLPMDRPRPQLQSFRGARLARELAPGLTQALKILCQQAQVTPFMALLAACQALLSRYSGQEDLVIGSPIANRTRTEIEGLIGFFVNTLVLRTDLSGDLSFRALLDRVRTVTLEAYAHQDLPFEKLVEELQPERNLDHEPLFQVVFALHNTLTETLRLPGFAVQAIELDPGTAKFDLTIHIMERGSGLTALIEYDTDLFEPATIARMLGHFSTLLEAATAAPAVRLRDLPLLTEPERAQALIEWNDTQRSLGDCCIPDLFERQADLRPDAVAVVCGSQTLTYGKLNRRADALAHYLQRLGVRLGDRVGVCAERSLAMVVGLLGILKAGGVYVPLDPSFPPERLRYMVEDARINTLVTGTSAGELDEIGVEKVINIEIDSGPLSAPDTIDFPRLVRPADAAYINYTSGSTGRPKGVVAPHIAVVRLLLFGSFVRLDERQRLLHLSPLSFDASTFELWGALLHGGQCILLPERAPAPEDIGRAIRERLITTMWLTASLFNLIIEETPQILSGVEQLLVGGEALSVNHIERALACLPNTELINGYGPTESTTFTCCHYIERAPNPQKRSAPIGRPITNTQVFILDRWMRPTPIGVLGELYIGGDGLAIGYLDLPELTADKFIPHPFSDQPGRRLYRSGDLVRHRPEGCVEFLGRVDHQVKVRGFRIELGEIETALASYRDVEKAVVVVREERPGDKRLIAYVVMREGVTPDMAALRRFLYGRLPTYMAPSAFVPLEALPLTPAGKIDRMALPAPDRSLSDLGGVYVAPQNETEAAIAAVWQEILEIEKVGIHDNFFDLGGHSLLLVKVNRRLRGMFKQDLSMVEMFRHPTISALAAYLGNEREEPPSYQQRYDRAATRRDSLKRRREFKKDHSATNT